MALSALSGYQIFYHPKNSKTFLTLPNVFNNKILLHFLSLGDSGLNFTDF